jgi:RNA polymerase sigma factor (sigma-70 family)
MQKRHGTEARATKQGFRDRKQPIISYRQLFLIYSVRFACLFKETKAMDPDKAVANDLYKQYGFLIYRTCLKILLSEEEARDALQTVFMKLMDHYDRIRDKERVVPWIFNAAKNHCYNVLRYNKKFIGAVDADTTAGRDRIDDQVADKELVRLAFRNHKKEVRDAVYYTYAEEFDQEEIRRITGQSPATIRRNLKKFRDSIPWLKKRLEMP